MSFDGIYGPPLYDHTIEPGGELTWDATPLGSDAVVIRGCVLARSLDAGAEDTLLVTIDSDTTDADYDISVRDFAALGLTANTNDKREWFHCPGQDGSVAGIWLCARFTIAGYSLAIPHPIQGHGITRAQFGQSFQFREVRHFPSSPAAMNELKVGLKSGAKLEEGSRLVLWKELV